MKKLVLISDYGSDSLTVQELRSALVGYLDQPLSSSVSFVNSTPNTIHTAFLLQQVLHTENLYGDPNNLVVFVNTDPRLQAIKGVEQAQGAQFVVIRLKNNVFICGPNAGYTYSLIRPNIQFLYLYRDFDKGSQFRSRDLYMRICALLMEEQEDEMELEEIRNTIIPVLEGFYIGHIDNYGNIKTTIPHSYLKGKHEYHEAIKITTNSTTKTATYVDNLFGKEPGALVIYPGSSGPKDDPYLEIAIWQHFPIQSALKEFNHAKPGDQIKLE